MNRRDILNTAMAGTAASLLLRNGRAADASAFSIIDTNVSLFQWPFRRLPLDDTDNLAKKFRVLGIKQVWAGSFEALLHRDLGAVNHRLVETCNRYPEFLPVGAINPGLPGWESDLRYCVQEQKMHAIRLHPNYHGYSLDHPRVSRLLEIASAEGLLVQISVAMEDFRTQHRLVQVPDVDLADLPQILVETPEVNVQILNHRNPLPELRKLKDFPNVSFDTSRVDGTDRTAELMRGFSKSRVMYGSHSPFLIPEAALIRAGESDLTTEELTSLFQKNAEIIMSRLKNR